MTGGRRLRRGPLMAGGMAVLAVALTGCGSPAPESARIAKSYDGQFSDMLSYASFGATSALDCADGKSLTVAGSNNKLTVRGSCEAVDVSGADNRITIERIGRTLTLTGLNNSVTYRDGRPKVDDRGSGNTVTAAR